MSTYVRGIIPGVNVVRTLVLALAANCGAAHLTGRAQAEDPPRSRIVVRLDSEVLVPVIECPIEEVQAVDEVILGVRMIGDANVAGQPRIKVVDDPHEAAFSVVVTGTIHTRTTGRKGPVQIYSRSTTQFTATKRIAFQPGRGFVGETAEFAARTSSQPERMVANRGGILGRSIERRAWVRAAQSSEQVNQIVQAMAEKKVREAFDRLLESRLAQVNQLAQQRYLAAALLGSRRYDCSTRGGWISIAVLSADESNSDSSPAPEVMRGRFGTLGREGPPIQVWVHEQVLGEPLAMLLWRVDLTRRFLGQLIVANQAFDKSEVALSSQPSSERSYGFAMIDGWFVIYNGPWNRTKLAVKATENSTSAPRTAIRGTGND
ncbi:MAG: hypothetical protein ACKVP0_26065 [Pirellulaceae bacterium]